MPNLTAMPSSFSKGSTVTYARTVLDYPATSGWGLTVYIAGRSVLTKAASASGADFSITLTAADTAGLEPGVYTWLERASKGAEVYDVARGTLSVTPDLATAAAGDLQSFDEKALAIVEAALLVDLASNTVSYQIAGRGETTTSRAEAMMLRDTLARRIARRKAGGRLGQTINVGFRRP